MLVPGYADITIYQGLTFELKTTAKYYDDNQVLQLVNFTGFTGYFSLKKRGSCDCYDYDGDSVLLGGVLGTLDVKIEPNYTIAPEFSFDYTDDMEPGFYDYSIDINTGDRIIPYLTGTAEIVARGCK